MRIVPSRPVKKNLHVSNNLFGGNLNEKMEYGTVRYPILREVAVSLTLDESLKFGFATPLSYVQLVYNALRVMYFLEHSARASPRSLAPEKRKWEDETHVT